MESPAGTRSSFSQKERGVGEGRFRAILVGIDGGGGYGEVQSNVGDSDSG